MPPDKTMEANNDGFNSILWNHHNSQQEEELEQEKKEEEELFLDFSLFPLVANERNNEMSESSYDHFFSETDQNFAFFESTSFAPEKEKFASLDTLNPRKQDKCDSCFTGILGEQTTSSSKPIKYQLWSCTKNGEKDKLRTTPQTCNSQAGKWAAQYKELLQFVNEKGNASFPNTQYKLGLDNKPSAMTQETQKSPLNSIDFVWDSPGNNDAWSEKIKALDEFRRIHGHCDVPINYKQDAELGIWVKCQRQQFSLYMAGKPSSMNPQRILELDNRCFQWEI